MKQASHCFALLRFALRRFCLLCLFLLVFGGVWSHVVVLLASACYLVVFACFCLLPYVFAAFVCFLMFLLHKTSLCVSLSLYIYICEQIVKYMLDGGNHIYNIFASDWLDTRYTFIYKMLWKSYNLEPMGFSMIAFLSKRIRGFGGKSKSLALTRMWAEGSWHGITRAVVG